MSRRLRYASPPQSIRVKLQPEDRFLTLVTTDDGDGVCNDWTLFAEPVLELTPEAGS